MLNRKLQELADKIQDANLRKKVTDFLENPTFSLDGKLYTGPNFEESPGGLKHHHNYAGGYLEHVAGTAEIAFTLCDVVEQVYAGKVNRDLVTAGILLHDIFKPVTYERDGNGEYASAPLADYLDHISLATAEMVRRDFPVELIHVVSAHYGTYGLIKPRTIEALVVHLADNTDSQLNGQVLDAAWYLTHRATGEPLPRMNSKEAFEVVRLKQTKAGKAWKKLSTKLRTSPSHRKLNCCDEED